jgi:hypothetical protein
MDLSYLQQYADGEIRSAYYLLRAEFEGRAEATAADDEIEIEPHATDGRHRRTWEDLAAENERFTRRGPRGFLETVAMASGTVTEADLYGLAADRREACAEASRQALSRFAGADGEPEA